ncbi:YdcF family protein [Kitasatospora sp. NBC_00240]|uniref:YdcF family protein n=1 Tax=Kitasatospora sp. NBC_00240 TaxID=2903567 RepID=UPI002253A719|nr:YdcF family protein [Kitasatospora sp. NBC_00240]MCX5216158.1 YdcF family protein [Kitasatospora sp. NBC_00240]
MVGTRPDISQDAWDDAQLLWDYHQLHHKIRPCSVIIGLGSHDLGVATHSAQLYFEKMAPLIVFSGSNSPTTVKRFPRGEAVHYGEHAVSLGVPRSAILLETRATNTAENFRFSREVLQAAGAPVTSVLLVSKPYEQRRSLATAMKTWPGVDVVCASEPVTLSEYVDRIGSVKTVVDMLVGTLQRLVEYPKKGFIVRQDVSAAAVGAYERLRARGFDSRVIPS